MKEDEIIVECSYIFSKAFGQPPIGITPIAASGSSRKYFRCVSPEGRYIVCISDNINENKTFLKLTRYLLTRNLPVPKIYYIDETYKSYILEDLGELDLMGLLKSKCKEEEKWEMIYSSISALVRFQQLPIAEWKEIVEFPALDSKLIRYDFQYAIDNFFSVQSIKYNSSRLNSELEKLEKRLLSYPKNLWGLMYRDFQSRNIMIHGKTYLIDYQSCRFGPGIYDLVSFSWQAKANFSEKDRKKIIAHYVKQWDLSGVSSGSSILDNVAYWAIFRIMQTLGAYGLRGLKEGKQHFIDSIPPALRNFQNLLNDYHLSSEYPELEGVIGRLDSFL